MTLDKSAMFYDLYKNLKVDIYLNAYYTFLSTVLSAIVYIFSFFFSLLLFLFLKFLVTPLVLVKLFFIKNAHRQTIAKSNNLRVS